MEGNGGLREVCALLGQGLNGRRQKKHPGFPTARPRSFGSTTSHHDGDQCTWFALILFLNF